MRAVRNGLLFLLPFFIAARLPAQAPRPLLEDIAWTNTAKSVALHNEYLRIEVSKETGAWTTFARRKPGPNLILPGLAADIVVDGQPGLARGGSRLQGVFVRPDPRRRSVTLEVALRVPARPGNGPDFGLTLHYTLYPHQARLDRSATLHYESPRAATGGAVRLEEFRFDLPGLLPGTAAECVVDVPGPFFPNTLVPPGTPYDSLRGRHIRFHSAPDAGFGLVGVSHPREGLTVAAWMHTAGETNYRPVLQGDGKRLTLGHHNYRYYRLLPGMSVASDTQRIVLTPDLPAALAAYRESVDATMPLAAPTPAWVKEMVLLEVYPAYFPDGIRGITAKLPFYREVGFNTLYLMPHWQGGYSPLDLFAVDPRYGTEADLRELVRAAHGLGMKVLFDMVIHGFNPASPVVAARPDLFIKDETGKPALHPTWKSVSTDWAGPAYRQYMADLVRHDVRTYGIDGYRVDAASYKGPAWAADLPYPAYRPGAAAPELMAHLLRALREGQPEAVLLSEVFGPVFYSVCNLAHDNQTEAPQLLLERIEKGQYTAAQYQEHLASVADALPAGANRVFFARNHDTSWFFHFNGYTPAFLALDAVHALFGIPEVFAGDPEHGPHPDADPGVYNHYRKLFRLKKDFPEWTHGRLRLRDIHSDNPHVFAGLRSTEAHTGIALVSLSGKAEAAPVFLGAGVLRAGRLVLRDALTGETVTVPREDDRFVVHLKPCQVLVGRIE
jgi:hypothetical protein